MQEQRIAQLQQMLQDNPQDPFLLYALALEYRNQDLQQAQTYFNTLLQQHPDYLPTYYHAAALYAETGLTDRAKQIYELGINLALQQNDAHTLRELRNAYQNLLLDLDEL
ncbi:hypothetical protein D770_03570 [Flammeovirgaceae bacterium 311]|nr:hypothetical protein D770_03570 [Flammeovirgaceae bacterium 311]